MKTILRLAKIRHQKIVETTVTFSVQENMKTMDRLAIIQEQKIVETTVRFSI